MASAADLARSGRRPPAPARSGGGEVALAVVAASISAGLVLWALGDLMLAAAFFAGLIATGGLLLLVPGRRSTPASAPEPAAPRLDAASLRAALDGAGPSVALVLTEADGALVSVSRSWSEWVGGASPMPLAEQAGRRALRDGSAEIESLSLDGRILRGTVSRVGQGGDRLLWRLAPATGPDLAGQASSWLGGDAGRRLGEAGVMAVLAASDGSIVAANRAFAARAAPDPDAPAPEGTMLVEHIAASETGRFYFGAEGPGATGLRIVHVATGDGEAAPSLFLLLDEVQGPRIGDGDTAAIHFLLDSLPLGLALADTDGRFTFLNKDFRKAAALAPGEQPAWPGDLVVDEDKAAVSDSVRRFGRGRALSSDMAVRLKSNPDEPVALRIAGARGLGNASVLLSLKDNSEEARLKREIAQATKMQAVGQLAGGVAHDFNNILTAILGTCDLMLMRHSPGDSDYDDIQQIRSNSNRAASLTRQLLAFSRQQTLRPQVLQLPDVVAEVSHLLTRLLGEKVRLEVKHGRGLGPIRADPGQLEQVIVNLAVNARDAILAKDPQGGGTLTLQTYAVPAEEVRRMGSDILPLGDYIAMKVADTGSGIPPHLIGKIFEPFFTTKEVGKGTGLGLSTVYGIVKQSGGFIFADSELGEGTEFTLYFPVHRAESGETPAAPRPRDKPAELWGSGTILLVEDEAMVRAVAERALTRHGYTVLAAENGEAALEILARGEAIDLMISDVVMPTMDGPTTVREARKTRPDLKILFISGYAEEQLRRSIDIEDVAFLAKPFSVQTLAETVRDALNAK